MYVCMYVCVYMCVYIYVTYIHVHTSNNVACTLCIQYSMYTILEIRTLHVHNLTDSCVSYNTIQSQRYIHYMYTILHIHTWHVYNFKVKQSACRDTCINRRDTCITCIQSYTSIHGIYTISEIHAYTL